MRSPIRLIFWSVLLAVVVISLAVAALGLDTTGIVPEKQRISAQDILRARDLFARYDPARMKPDELATITVTPAELDIAISAALSRLQQVRSRVVANRAEVSVDATYELHVPPNPLGRFVNLRVGIVASDHGLKISRFAVGALNLPPQIVTPLVRLGFDFLVGSSKVADILASVKSANIAGDQVTIVYQPPKDLVGSFRVAEPAKVRVYYEHLHQRVIQAGVTPQSLAVYVGEVFRLAELRSADSDPVAENKAAIVALAMYFGDERFERLAGEVRIGALKLVVPRVDHIQLEGRRDWVQHFVVSAGLVVASTVGIANVVGEAKEVKDSEGPSGFSFTDIGADRAGVRFAERAIASPTSARAIQHALARPIEEPEFFPRVQDLPEGLSDAEFRRRYGETNSPEFAQMIVEIDRRIVAIPLYR